MSIPRLKLPTWGQPLAMPRDRVSYSGWWTTIRRRQLTAYPLCNRCGATADEVHHKVPIEAGGHRFSYDNLESLCSPCHRAHHSR